jgi:tRNA-Thr(GGU) m(6)t(6)A37 methyltransferase TsaA
MLDFKTMIHLKPVGVVRSTRKEVTDDHWLKEDAYIELTPDYKPDALAGLTDFSHVEILFYMNQVKPEKIETSARHPRGNTHWPEVGIFAQRGKNRPNQIGLTVCDVVKVEGRKIFVRGLDAVDGTPVIDIKPWMKEFGPRGPVRQPEWSSELMKEYWQATT